MKMSAWTLTRFVIFCAVCTPVHFSPSKSCTRFQFPNPEDTVLTARENATVELPFQLNISNCSDIQDLTITVSKLNNITGLPVDYCSFQLLPEDGCVSSGSGCVCTDSKGGFLFTKSVDRNDNTEWIWWTSDGFAEEGRIKFDVTYSAEIKRLELKSQFKDGLDIVEANRPLIVVCVFDEGNPPVTARLLDRHGVEMEGSNRNGQIQFRFPAVGCQDAGLIRCEAPGASHNKSALLLVRCAPTFLGDLPLELDITAGQDAEFTVPFTAHTAHIQTCRLNRAPFTGEEQVSIMRSWSKSGTPPDLTLTVRLDNVRKEEEGQWRLELTNDAGTGYMDFTLNIIDGASAPDDHDTAPAEVTDVWDSDTETTSTTTEKTGMQQSITIIAASTGAAVVVTLLLAIACLICVRQRRKTESKRIQSIPMMNIVHPPAPLQGSPPSSSGSVNFYHEIQDNSPSASSRLCGDQDSQVASPMAPSAAEAATATAAAPEGAAADTASFKDQQHVGHQLAPEHRRETHKVTASQSASSQGYQDQRNSRDLYLSPTLETRHSQRARKARETQKTLPKKL